MVLIHRVKKTSLMMRVHSSDMYHSHVFYCRSDYKRTPYFSSIPLRIALYDVAAIPTEGILHLQYIITRCVMTVLAVLSRQHVLLIQCRCLLYVLWPQSWWMWYMKIMWHFPAKTLTNERYDYSINGIFDHTSNWWCCQENNTEYILVLYK